MDGISLLADTILLLKVLADTSISVVGRKSSKGGVRPGVGSGLVVKEVTAFVVFINEEISPDFGLGVVVRKDVCNTLLDRGAPPKISQYKKGGAPNYPDVGLVVVLGAITEIREYPGRSVGIWDSEH